MDVVQLKKTILEVLAEAEDISLCILYGSAAENRLSPNSDIDIALGADAFISPDRLAELQTALSCAVRRDADVVDVRRCNGVFLQQVLTKGDVLLKQDLLLYAELIRRMWYFNADMRKNYEYVLHQQIKRAVHGT